MRRMYLALAVLSLVVFATSTRAVEPLQMPRFRHVDKLTPKPESALPPKLVLLADEDFAPYSFKSADGRVLGLSVDIATAACAELKVACEVRALPFARLAEELRARHGDVIIGGIPAPAAAALGLIATRPYFYSASRFVIRTAAAISDIQPKTVAGRRLGFVKGSLQEAYVKKNFDRAFLQPFESEGVMLETLRTGGLDLAFVDSVRAGFWLKGEGSRGCCVAVGASFADRAGLSRGLSMMLRAGDENLRAAFDYGLDKAQESGASAKAMAAYLPTSPY